MTFHPELSLLRFWLWHESSAGQPPSTAISICPVTSKQGVTPSSSAQQQEKTVRPLVLNQLEGGCLFLMSLSAYGDFQNLDRREDLI
ncbi:hypothetical protein GJAV_G00090240 [Gymnothorax javanicus]|nr:hypothetical protein GJAV_G00090240 [Gymnothorax javanicus]